MNAVLGEGTQRGFRVTGKPCRFRQGHETKFFCQLKVAVELAA